LFYREKYYKFFIRKIFDIYNFLFAHSYKSNNLKSILALCSREIDYYKGKGTDIRYYGYIDNNVVRSSFNSFARKGLSIKKPGYTSGTTGSPSKYLWDFRSMAAEQYFQNKYFGWSKKYKVVFRGEKLFEPDEMPEKIYKTVPFIKEMYISSFHINDNTLKNLVEKLKTIPDKCLWAYPSTAFILAEYCIRTGEKLEFDVVATSSETLLDNQVEVIEKAFNCRIKDWYGHAERAAALIRCEHGHYHEVENYSHVEYIERGDNTCEITGTTLHNRIMPLIRYMTNDMVEISPGKCPCGHQSTNILKIHGRRSSYIDLPNKRIPECLFGCLIKKTRNVFQFQVVQTKQKEIIYKIVKGEGFNQEDEKLLLNTIYGTLPREFCTVKYVDSIERDKSGKFRYVINENAG